MTAGDYDNDGWVDLYLTNLGPDVLYHNNGDGTFTDVTEKAGIRAPVQREGSPPSSTPGPGGRGRRACSAAPTT